MFTPPTKIVKIGDDGPYCCTNNTTNVFCLVKEHEGTFLGLQNSPMPSHTHLEAV